MATNKGSGSRRAIPIISRRRSPYTVLMEHSASLNRAFDLVLEEVAWLRKMGFFWGEVSCRFMKTCRLSLEELRAWAMAELTQDLLERGGGLGPLWRAAVPVGGEVPRSTGCREAGGASEEATAGAGEEKPAKRA
jgi:hypothetical protein